MHRLTVDAFADLIEPVQELSLWIGLSGGVDSVVLLHLCKQLRDLGKLKNLSCIHVHHGLSSNANNWAQFCSDLCARCALPLQIAKVNVNTRQKNEKKGIESAARVERYAAFEHYLPKGTCLLLAHHLNDQCETFLFRVFRGTGIDGLAAIPQKRILTQSILFRPFLKVSRRLIQQYAYDHELKWIHDESNDLCTYDRNFIRHTIWPAIQQRWPAVEKSLSRLAAIAFDATEILQEVAACDLSAIYQPMDAYSLQPAGLSLFYFKQLTVARQKNLLRYWLHQQKSLISISSDLVTQVLTEVVSAKIGSAPAVVISGTGIMVRRHQKRLVMCPQNIDDIDWQESFSVHITYESLIKWFNQIKLKGDDSQARVLRDLKIQPVVEGFGVDLILLKQRLAGRCLTISYRHQLAIDAFELPGRTGRKQLKKWLNELAIPVWIRDKLPILHVDKEVIAAPGGLINACFASDTENNRFVFLLDKLFCL